MTDYLLKKGILLICLVSSCTVTKIHASMDTIPVLNQNIIKFVSKVIGKKVDRGQCWDLAAKALDEVGANWNHEYKFGVLLNPKLDSIYPGDIIQFENVKLKYEINGGKFYEEMQHHTAIIYEVLNQTEFVLAHQNTGFSGKKVGLSPIDLKTLKKGKIKIYRPSL